MKQYLSTFAGSAICGGFAFGIWPELWKTYGLMGGWLAATLIIGIMWYMKYGWIRAGVSALRELPGGLSAFKAISPISFMQYLP